ncbi:MAG: DUF805 domain-containing protein [Veillonella sp.]|nr:DUF805 domain-containing protein [Veillonella sp.]
MVELSFDLIIAAFAMIILNCRGYYKYAMSKQLSEREAARREFMLFPNLYKWVCICSSLLIIVAFTYYCIEGLTTNSFRFMIIAGISFLVRNIEMLRVNQRIGRLAYLWGVLGLMVSKFLAYLMFGLLAVLIQDSSLQDSQYLSYIYFGCLQIMHVIATIFLLKRRLNDCGSSLWYMILVPIAYLSLWMYWGMSFSWGAISETIVNESFYWDGFFWQYFILACFALPLSVPESNEYGLDEGRDRYNNYIIAYDRSSTVSEVVYGMFYLLSSLILKEDLPHQPFGLVL